jgi:hypothetical protein
VRYQTALRPGDQRNDTLVTPFCQSKPRVL